MGVLSAPAREGKLQTVRRRFDGKVVVVTGASAGVGRAIAHRFAVLGASVGLLSRDEQALRELETELDALGVNAKAIAVDVADAEAVFAAAHALEESLGPIDIWINNAMVTVYAPVSDLSPEEFRRVTEVTYLGSVYGTMAALRLMRARNSGRILQIGSALAYRGIPLQSAYCGAKHALRGFLDSLRSELIRENSAIRLTMIQLPAVDTPQFDWARTHRKRQPRPVPPVYTPETVANAVVHAAEKGGREYWLGAGTIKAIVGNMVLPSYLDRLLARGVYDGQERDQPVEPDRRDNLQEPVEGLHRTHGSFGGEARSFVMPWSDNTVRLGVFGLGLAVLASMLAIAGSARGRRRRRSHWR